MTSSILGGIVTPPLPLVIIRHFLATPPLVSVTRDNTGPATKQRRLGS